MLKRGEPLALATDEGAEGFLLVAHRDDVEATGLTGLDLDLDGEPEVAHQLLKDRLACGERLGRRF